MSEESGLNYLSADDVLTIHELIVESNEDTEPGVSSRGDVEYAVEFVRGDHVDTADGSIHERAFQLLRLVTVNHPFVDGNKRTALMSVRVFYALNRLRFDYDPGIKSILKRLATDEAAVREERVLSYLRNHTESLATEYAATVELWVSRIETVDSIPSDTGTPSDGESQGDPNGYDGDHRSGG